MTHKQRDIRFLFPTLGALASSVAVVVAVIAFPLFALAQDATITDSTNVSQLLPPSAPTGVTVADAPHDGGRAVIVTFVPAVSSSPAQAQILGYEVYRSLSAAGPWKKVGAVPPDVTATLTYKDAGGKDQASDDYFPKDTDLYYRVRSMTPDSALFADSKVAGPVQGTGQWWNGGRSAVFWFVLLFTVLTLYFLRAARTRGESLYVRPLAGIDAVDEAIGRATEMGKPILYVLGLGTAADSERYTS